MSKKFLLYFKKINMEKTNLILLKNKFHVIELNNISSINNLNQKIREKITIIYCDPSYFYSKFYLEKFINLKILASSTTGKGFIDENFCIKKNIKIICLENEKKFLKSITPTAEHVFGLILLLTRNYYEAISSVNNGLFNRRLFGGFAMLSQMTIGIIGYGRLGKIVKKIAKGFNMKILYCDIKMSDYKIKLKNLLKNSDMVTLHIPSRDNLKFFGKKMDKYFKKPFFLVNTSRGDVVDEVFIISMLKKQKILGYATDVLDGEFSADFKLKNNIIYKNRKKFKIIITPHIGGSTKDAWKKTEYKVIKKLI
jgi:phosphoglycerate dehydrogenase-like enzyme